MSKEHSPIHKFISQMAKLNGLPNAERLDEQNILVYERELEGNSAFDFNADDVEDIFNRSWVLFRGLSDVAPHPEMLEYSWKLIVFGELKHYDNDEGQTRYKEEAQELDEWLSEREHQYRHIAAVYSVSQARQEKSWD